MSKFKYIDDGLWQAAYNLKQDLKELEEDLSKKRESTRYWNSKYHAERKILKHLNNRKHRLVRQLSKVNELQAQLNPKPPKKAASEEQDHER